MCSSDLDLLKQYLQRSIEIENMPAQERNSPEVRFELGNKYFGLGEYEKALEEFEAILKLPRDNSFDFLGMKFSDFRLLSLARLKRSQEMEVALAEWRATNPSPGDTIYTESLILLWLGRKADALARLEKGLASDEVLNRNTRYALARTLARFAADETASSEEKMQWTDRAIATLQGWSDGSDYDRNTVQSELDFLNLHSHPHFIRLTAPQADIPEQPYWMASREVTRGEFEAFFKDASSDIQKPTDRDESKLNSYDDKSPTGEHPAQNVSWYDAVLYCNWLSRKDKLTPAYKSVGKVKKMTSVAEAIEVDIWQPVEEANGYRLPSVLEWD